MPDALVIEGIDKSFGAHRVLRQVDLVLPAGTVTVLMGANGAGKSTLVKILSGVHRHDAGRMSLDARPFAPRDPIAARSAGVETVHQSIDDGVVPDLDVTANLMLESIAAGATGVWYRRARLRAAAREIANGMGLSLDLDAPVHTLGLADRQLVAIARAMATSPRVLILDEPTSSLSAREADRLFELVDRLREQGVAILFISHRLSDIRRIADRIVALRDGTVSGVFDTAPLNLDAAVDAMLGRASIAGDIDVRHGDVPVLQIEALVLTEHATPFSLTLHANEIVAVTGLVGSGKQALADTLFGVRRPIAGRLVLDARDYAPAGPADAVAAGVFLAPRDRASNAVVPDFDLAANMSLPFVEHFCRAGRLSRRRERAAAGELIDRLGIVCRDPTDRIGTLSGGNQQKVMVARWLSRPCRVLVLDEPFQGVDIQARRDIGARLRQDAAGRTTLVLVSELDEALEIADRLVVMQAQTITHEQTNLTPDVERLQQAIAGVAPAAS